ncbi:GmrSD restriction endonuclease domain-containing protein [Arthrobacter mobilis]|uniref:DUF1524 domain-containing protein n=1 Tax=Arthrobacter mobilis TaxID=2724944 RepID=A0A7X6HHD5_9MICC|nr:DUF1524 domain-containing protein [Arthrobacter mobilis]NKX56249.1 DUF1524 domain-containing protein [Arthrobacter mobilis]
MNVSFRTTVLSALAAVLVAAGAAGCGQPGAAGASAATAAQPAEASQPAQPQPARTAEAGGSGTPAQQQPSAQQQAETRAGTALAQLSTIGIKGRAPKTGYSRDRFGDGWQDPDGNGCDARNDILNRDLAGIRHRAGTHGCIVTSGTLNDPYTAARISFVRGNATSTAVQIDHVVALSDAWQKGAQLLSARQRLAFANDPLNLIAADGPANGAKSDSDAASWLPPNRGFRCRYVARQTAVKAKYGLWMTQAEHDAIARVLSSCPQEPVPSAAVAARRTTAAAAAGTSRIPAEASRSGVPSYRNCTEVKAAGEAPIRAGDPGWDTKFDRDGDGVGCES